MKTMQKKKAWGSGPILYVIIPNSVIRSYPTEEIFVKRHQGGKIDP